MKHIEVQRTHRIGWLRAAVLGADDGIVSTASLVVGVAAAGANRAAILIAGMAGLVGGAMSMAAGEFVSVSSQADTERAALAVERKELRTEPEAELAELAGLFQARGVDAKVAQEVAEQLTARDAIGAHAREELGITEMTSARPVQAAVTSALAFTVGAALPLLVAALFTGSLRVWLVGSSALVFLAALGVVGARLGGAPAGKAAARVTFWGALAMIVTAAIGKAFGAVV
ncbi:MAG: VIT family protein [Acidimicrobiia bacterium]|nr:VIT family protein [Acidimicrobiia bacterium]